jgi:hypothetical protein
MRPAAGTSADYAEGGYLRDVAAEQAVKGGGDQTPRSPASTLDRRATARRTHHEPPGDPVASQRRAGALRKSNTPPDQHECPPFSIGKPDREKHGHKPSPRAGCGKVWSGPSKTDPDIWMAKWFPDRTMDCPNCGPWVRAQKAAAYLAKIGDQQLYQRVVPKEWETSKRALRRAEADYLQVPTVDRERLVLVNQPRPGWEPVADNQALVTAAIAAAPAGGDMNISASRAWQIAVPRSKPADKPERQAYDLRYLVGVGLHLRQVTRDLGLYLEESGQDGSAFLYRKPDDPLTWSRLVRWGGLWDPADPRTRTRPGKRRPPPETEEMAA